MWRRPLRAAMDHLAERYITQPLLRSPTFVKSVQSVHKHFIDFKQGKLDLSKFQEDVANLRHSSEVQDELNEIRRRSQEEFAQMRQRGEAFKSRAEEFRQQTEDFSQRTAQQVRRTAEDARSKAEDVRPTFFEWLMGEEPKQPPTETKAEAARKLLESDTWKSKS